MTPMPRIRTGSTRIQRWRNDPFDFKPYNKYSRKSEHSRGEKRGRTQGHGDLTKPDCRYGAVDGD
jgi:hypothetical protein